MPYLQLDLPIAVAAAERRTLASRLARLYAESMDTDAQRVTVAFRELGEDGVLRDGPRGVETVVVVSCDIRRGRPAETRLRLGDRVAALLEDALGWPRERVILEFTQHAGDEIYRDGRLAEDWTPAEAGSAAPAS
jgi:phenylpyruvate tautomerase PptA (4-oxalocrotonate tautomerase family)